MNADHKLGRSEAIRDASRSISQALDQVNAEIVERYDELDRIRLQGTMVFAEDDKKMQNLQGRRDALYEAHTRVCSL